MDENKETIISLKTTEDEILMFCVEAQLNAGQDTPTFFPNHLGRTSDGKWWKFCTNVFNEKMDHILAVIDGLKCENYLKLSKEAVDDDGNLLPDYFSIWATIEGIPDDLTSEFVALDLALSERYQELLIECGIKEAESINIPDIYIGCEKDLWPDKPWITKKIIELATHK